MPGTHPLPSITGIRGFPIGVDMDVVDICLGSSKKFHGRTLVAQNICYRVYYNPVTDKLAVFAPGTKIHHFWTYVGQL